MSGSWTFLGGAALLSAILLGLSLVAAAIRVARGPTVSDRVLGLDLATNLAVCFLGVAALGPGSTALVDVAFGVAAVGFLATLAFAWFIEKRGRR